MRQFISTFVVLRLIIGLLICPQARADDYYYIPLKELTLTSGSWPTGQHEDKPQWDRSPYTSSFVMEPHAAGHTGEEMYLAYLTDPIEWRQPFLSSFFTIHISIRSTTGKTPTGRVFFPKDDWSGMSYVDFIVSATPGDQTKAKRHFLEAKRRHYTELWGQNIPGSAWFRHQVEITTREQGKKPPSAEAVSPNNFTAEDSLTYSLFTGGRAISENLQLDRSLRNITATTETVPLESIEGITTASYNWSKWLKGGKPELDPLASAIPADQHALFFPSFQVMLNMLDEVEKQGTPIYGLLETRAESARTRERYQHQLCLSPDALSRLLGPSLVSSAAFTGSDPYLPTGSDVAVLFEAPNPALLRLALAGRHSAAIATSKEVHSVAGTIRGVGYTGVVSPDRRVCSYIATVGNVVAVSNSLYQLERVIATAQGQTPSMSTLDEYRFFRQRYPRGQTDETALLVVTDGAIRRWCGPRWRILASRRARAAASLAEIQAASLVQIASGPLGPGVQLPDQLDGIGEVSISTKGVSSSVYGNLEFLTPIAEISATSVTKGEKQAYEWFRDSYQRNWRRYFDPIAIRFSLSDELLAADLSIRPLIAASDYREFINITGAPQDLPDATEVCPHPLMQLSFSFDPKAERLNRDLGFWLAPGSALARIGFSWLGNWVTIILEESDFWKKLGPVLSQGGDSAGFEYAAENHQLVPLSVVFDVGNSFALTAFLPALRSMIEQSAPDMTRWETLTQNDQSYVQISVLDKTGEWTPALHYAVTPKRLILSLNKDLLISELAYVKGTASEGRVLASPENTFSNLELHMGPDALTILDLFSRDPLESVRRERSWGNLPILNEWHRLAPDKSAVDFHEQFWYTRLTCPGGGQYVWNEEYRTYESTVYGHPGQPKTSEDSASLLNAFEKIGTSLVFEEDGLRSRCEIYRKHIQ